MLAKNWSHWGYSVLPYVTSFTGRNIRRRRPRELKKPGVKRNNCGIVIPIYYINPLVLKIVLYIDTIG